MLGSTSSTLDLLFAAISNPRRCSTRIDRGMMIAYGSYNHEIEAMEAAGAGDRHLDSMGLCLRPAVGCSRCGGNSGGRFPGDGGLRL